MAAMSIDSAMRKFHYCSILIIVLCTVAAVKTTAQIVVRGTVESESNEPLSFATAVLLGLDSLPLAQERTFENGNFQLFVPKKEEMVLLKIIYVGYENYEKQLIFPSIGSKRDTFDIGKIRLTPLSKLLSETIITAQRDPVTIKGDTTEFAASGYKTQPNDNADALIKQLPGVEVDRDGAVRAKGQDVKQVFVNGKPFFGGDPRLAMANLSADAIQSVQVFERKSDQAEFTGIDDGQREMTLNIIIKPSHNKRTTGRMTAGYGTENRYSMRGNASKFNDGQQLSILGAANNVNRAGFSQDDFSAFANNQRPVNEQNPQQNAVKGFQSVQSGGLNWSDHWGKKNESNISYFYNNLDVLNDRQVYRQNFLPTNFYTNRSQSNAYTGNSNHRLNGFIDQKLGALTSVKLTGNLNLSETGNGHTTKSTNLRGDTSLQNTARKWADTRGDGFWGSSNLILRQRFSKKGRSTSLNLNYSRNASNRTTLSDATTEFFNPDTRILRRIDTINQSDDNRSRRNSYAATLSYVEPLHKNWFAEANYRYSAILAQTDRDVFNIQKGETNNNLSIFYTSAFNSHRAGLSLRFNKVLKNKDLGSKNNVNASENTSDASTSNQQNRRNPKNAAPSASNAAQNMNVAIGLQAQQSLLKGDFSSRGYYIQTPFRYLLPNAKFEYNPSQTNRFNLHYDTDVREPAIEQLQPVVNNNDPQNLYYGNPNLRPEYQNRLRLMYSNFNRKTYAYFNGSVNYSFIEQKIVNELSVDSLLRRSFRPVNIDGFADAAIHAALGFRFWKQRLRLNITSNVTHSKGKNPVNGVENFTNRFNAHFSSRAELRFQDTFELAIKAAVRRNATNYSIQTQLDQTFWVYDYEVDMTVRLPFDMRFNGNFDYNLLVANTFGKTQGIPILSAYVNKFFQQRRYELRLTVVDILNRNTGIIRTAEANYLQEEVIRSLGRYGLLSLTYAIHKRPQKGKK
jgi:Outer membrane protein beta-barrel family